MEQVDPIAEDYDALSRLIESEKSTLIMGTGVDVTVDPSDATPILPAHIEDTIRAIAKLHEDHDNEATPMERLVDRLTAVLAQPTFIGALTAVVTLWVGGNLALLALGRSTLDPPPFNVLQGVLTLATVYMTGLILTTQRRADRLASHREQLTLELAILAEQKNAKTIQLLEELRRDSPQIRDRVDPMAEEMSTPADPAAVLDAIKETQGSLSSSNFGLQPETADLDKTEETRNPT